MTILRSVTAEIFGLFIDDSHLALLVVALVLSLGLLAYAVPTSAPLLGFILLFGCLAILTFTTLRVNDRR